MIGDLVLDLERDGLGDLGILCILVVVVVVVDRKKRKRKVDVMRFPPLKLVRA